MSLYHDLLWLFPSRKFGAVVFASACVLAVAVDTDFSDILVENVTEKRLAAQLATQNARLATLERVGSNKAVKGPIFPTAIESISGRLDMTIVGSVKLRPAVKE